MAKNLCPRFWFTSFNVFFQHISQTTLGFSKLNSDVTGALPSKNFHITDTMKEWFENNNKYKEDRTRKMCTSISEPREPV